MSYVWPFLVSFLLTFALTPFVINLAVRSHAVDLPGERKVHFKPTPRWGGIGLFIGILGGAVFAYFSSHSFHQALVKRHLDDTAAIAGGMLIMLVLGILDDLKPVSVKWKLFWQIAAAVWLIILGVKISFISFPAGGKIVYLPFFISLVLSLFWIVGITNSLNLLDGLDGLLAGISTISALFFFAIELEKGYLFPAFLLLAVSGASLGFLYYNFNPAKIFLGDSGSLSLGILWASLTIVGTLKTSITAVFVPLLILGLPILDTLVAIFRRFGKGKNIFVPDKEHLHHQLLKLGFSQKKAVLLLYLVTGILASVAFFLSR
jgi:UDP-GlcNAc:undecaprenyl-phosphate GlcNAc-1-phosphate transferase